MANRVAVGLADPAKPGVGGLLPGDVLVDGDGNPVGGGISDGDKGDVTVSGGGAVWTVDPLPQSRITNLTTDLSALDAALAVVEAIVADGDKGEITVASSGANWTIDAGVVTTTKLGGDITTAGKALLDDADNVAQRTTLGLGTLATQNGTFSGTSSGTNTGDQSSVSGNAGTATALATGRTIATTGDVGYTSPSFDGTANVSAAATIANDAVTYAKMQNVSATDRLLGRSTAGAGDVEEVPCTAFARTILDDVDGPAVRTTIGAGTGNGTVTSVSGTAPIASSGGATPAISLDNDGVTYAKMQNVSAASKLLGRGDSGSGDPQEITLGTNLSMAGTTLNAAAAGANTLFAPGSVTIADGNFWIQCKRLALTTTQRLAVAGTGRYRGTN